MAGRQGWNLRGPHKVVLRGEASPQWKGDAANPSTKRARARKMYPLGPCEKCGRQAVDRHHRDGNTGNNARDNVAVLCRRCHMDEDGRLAVFKLTSTSLRGPQPPKPCANCKRLKKPLWRGRCHACNEYFRRRGVERPYVEDGRAEKAIPRCLLEPGAADRLCRRREAQRERRERKAAASGQLPFPALAAMPEHGRRA